MFAKLTTKIALRKAGLPSSLPSMPAYNTSSSSDPKDPNANTSPFAALSNINITIPKALKSWQTPPPPKIEMAKDTPILGTRAPSCGKLSLPMENGRPTIVVMMRHVGCPFAEKTFLELRRLANKFPSLNFVAVSHASQAATDRWVSQIGGAWAIKIIVDEEREVYATWGLGVSTTYHLLNPWTQVAMRKLGTEEGIWGRECGEGGNRWVVGGAWAVDEIGNVRWGAASKTADDIPELMVGCNALGAY